MIERKIQIDGKPVPFKASAAVPRKYRHRFGRDIFKDLSSLGKSIEKAKEGEIPISDLEMFENVAYVMAKFADPSQPDTPEEWLDQFDMLSIYEVLPQILDLWHLNIQTSVDQKKKRGPQRVK